MMNTTEILLALLTFNSIALFIMLSIMLVHIRDVLTTLRRIQEEAREVRYFYMIEYKKSNKKEDK